MKCDLSKERLIGYFYEDLPDEAIKDVKLHLKNAPFVKKSWRNLAKPLTFLRPGRMKSPG